MPTSDPAEGFAAYGSEWVEGMEEPGLVHTHYEHPAMLSMLPPLTGTRVLCLACGLGQECRTMQEYGAASVRGIDVSPALIQRARELHPDIPFDVIDMEALPSGDETFDFVYCSKAMHYVKDWRTVLGPVSRMLSDGGQMLLSFHHPATWWAELDEFPGGRMKRIGYRSTDDGGLKVWGDYFDTSMREEPWGGGPPMKHYHAPLSERLRSIWDSGLQLVDMHEPQPLPEAREIVANVHELFARIPMFLILLLQKQ